MHGPPTPPPVAPPVVPPPLPQEESLPRAFTSAWKTPSRRTRPLRDCTIGGACLLVGILVGQGSWWSGDNVTESASNVSIESVEQNASVADSSIIDVVPASSSEEKTVDLNGLNDLNQSVGHRGTSVERDPSTSEPIFARPAEAAPEETVKNDPIPAASADSESKHLVTVHAIKDESEPVVPPAFGTVSESPVESIISLASASMTAHAIPEVETCQAGMESLGTSLKWADTPADAYRTAAEQNKLVFLIHVSGNFKIPGFT